MEKEIYKILLEYKTLQNQKNDLSKLIFEDLSKHGFTEVKTGIITSLDGNFQKELDPLFSGIKALGCDVVLTSGKRSPGELKTSLHPHGKALDIQPTKVDCYCKIMNLCAQSNFSKLFCLDERRRVSPDWSGPHIHIELKQSNKSTKPCDSSKAISDIFGSGSTSSSSSQTGTTSPDELISTMSKELFRKYHPNLKESKENKEFSEGFNLEDVKVKGGNKVLYKSNKHPRIHSPVDGKIVVIPDENCENSFSILTSDKKYLLQFCGVKGHDFQNGQTVYEGQLLGSNTDIVTVTVMTKDGRSVNKLPDSLIDSEKNKNKNKTNNDTDNVFATTSQDPLISFLVSAPFKAPGYIGSKIKAAVKKLKKEDENVNESVIKVINDINKIKKLIK